MVDLARIVRRIVQDNIRKEYIFAVDRTKKPTQKRIVEAISKGIGTGKTKSINSTYSFVNTAEFLSINLKIKTSDVFKDGEPPEDAEDPEEEAKKLKFAWHCQTGVIGNIRMLNEEFNQNRGLNPVKIFISGPPASGKTYYADLLATHYNIPKINVKQLVDQALTMARIEDDAEASELAQEIKAKVEELREAMV